MKVLTTQELNDKINSGESFLVDLYADWCAPCRALGPMIEKIANQLESEGSEVNVYKFNIETDKETAVKLGVRSIPTIKSFKNGHEQNSVVGMVGESQIMQMVDELR